MASHTLTMTLGPMSRPGTKVELDGADITETLVGLTIGAHAGNVTKVRLELVPTSVVAMLTDPDIVRAPTPEEIAAAGLPELERIAVARLKPGDVIVVESWDVITSPAAERISALLRRVWPDHPVVIMERGMTLKLAEGEGG